MANVRSPFFPFFFIFFFAFPLPQLSIPPLDMLSLSRAHPQAMNRGSQSQPQRTARCRLIVEAHPPTVAAVEPYNNVRRPDQSIISWIELEMSVPTSQALGDHSSSIAQLRYPQ